MQPIRQQSFQPTGIPAVCLDSRRLVTNPNPNPNPFFTMPPASTESAKFIGAYRRDGTTDRQISSKECLRSITNNVSMLFLSFIRQLDY